MSDENDSYYASGKKIRLIRSKDTFALDREGYIPSFIIFLFLNSKRLSRNCF